MNLEFTVLKFLSGNTKFINVQVRSSKIHIHNLGIQKFLNSKCEFTSTNLFLKKTSKILDTNGYEPKDFFFKLNEPKPERLVK